MPSIGLLIVLELKGELKLFEEQQERKKQDEK